MLFIIIALLCALICFYMAKGRGRSPWLGAVAGFFFGIFAMIYYLGAGDTREKKEEREIESLKRLKQIMRDDE
jgi:formate hydrogenlyase subunit 3/multisubunit Na+/H+ antiporter MnhD subunit